MILYPTSGDLHEKYEITNLKRSSMLMLIVALFTTLRTWNQPKHPPTEDRDAVYITMEH